VRVDDDRLHGGRNDLMLIAVVAEGVVAVSRSSFDVVQQHDQDSSGVATSGGNNKPRLRPNGLPWNIPMASEIGTVMDGPPPGYAGDDGSSRAIGMFAATPGDQQHDGSGAVGPSPLPPFLTGDVVTSAVSPRFHLL
jgi:hypothetical protein